MKINHNPKHTPLEATTTKARAIGGNDEVNDEVLSS